MAFAPDPPYFYTTVVFMIELMHFYIILSRDRHPLYLSYTAIRTRLTLAFAVITPPPSLRRIKK